MDRLIPALIVVAVVIVLFALVWWGWCSRQRSQSAQFPAPPRPVEGMPVRTEPVAGMYVATTLSEQPLERVAAHGLGLRTSAFLSVADDGVIIDRDGVDDLLIPAAAITGITTASGMIGKFVEKDGLIVITWRLGDTPVDTGFRTRTAADRTPTIDHIRQLIGENS
ncbi:transporter [Nocardia zapadnayensis]|uniref:PH-like domain-containing protein n=1 Tax=uncultured Brevibacterium sp. TaxID=189678 RepID=UPI002247FEA4|nr:transporter [Nocardia zapadnayensis]MCX0278054.1 transporter [Nocardia zapadnayensis]